MKTALGKFYLAIGLAGIGLFSWYTVSGKEPRASTRRFIPADVRAQARSSPGGIRTFHFWHVGYGGYRGGK